MTGCERRTGNRRCSPTVYATIPWVWGLAVLLVVVFVEGCGGRSISGDSDGGSSGLDGGIPDCTDNPRPTGRLLGAPNAKA